MKIITNFQALIINCKKQEYKRKDGSVANLCQISLDQDGEAGTMACTEDVLDKVERLKDFTVVAEFNDQYKSFRVIDLLPIPFD